MAGKQPMDMITYYRLFGMTRQPQETVDVQTFNTNSKHITAAHNKNVSNEYAILFGLYYKTWYYIL